MAKTRKYIDWDSVEPLYRAGAMSLNDICNQYAADHVNSQVWKTTVTHAAILKHAKQKGWTKNIAARVSERLKERLVTSLVTIGNQSEDEAIEQATEEPVRIAFGQRARTAEALSFVDELLKELRYQFKLEKEKAGKGPVDVSGAVKTFKDIVASLRSLQDQQSVQYGLSGISSTPMAGIDVCFVSADE